MGTDAAAALDGRLTITHIDRVCTSHLLHLIAPRSRWQHVSSEALPDEEEPAARAEPALRSSVLDVLRTLPT